MKKIRLICAVLLLMSFLLALVACGDNETADTDALSSDTVATETDGESSGTVADTTAPAAGGYSPSGEQLPIIWE